MGEEESIIDACLFGGTFSEVTGLGVMVAEVVVGLFGVVGIGAGLGGVEGAAGSLAMLWKEGTGLMMGFGGMRTVWDCA